MKISEVLSDCKNIADNLNEVGGNGNTSADAIVRNLNHVLGQLQNLLEDIGAEGENIVFPKKVELDREQKNKLRRLFADYQSQYNSDDWEDEGGWSAFSLWRKAIFEDMKELSGLDDVDDIAANIWTANQLKFVRECEEEGHEIDWTYSGRGMFGEICPAVRCDSESEIQTTAKYLTDGMGLGIVCYARY